MPVVIVHASRFGLRASREKMNCRGAGSQATSIVSSGSSAHSPLVAAAPVRARPARRAWSSSPLSPFCMALHTCTYVLPFNRDAHIFWRCPHHALTLGD